MKLIVSMMWSSKINRRNFIFIEWQLKNFENRMKINSLDTHYNISQAYNVHLPVSTVFICTRIPLRLYHTPQCRHIFSQAYTKHSAPYRLDYHEPRPRGNQEKLKSEEWRRPKCESLWTFYTMNRKYLRRIFSWKETNQHAHFMARCIL